jgi:hypothetical protein
MPNQHSLTDLRIDEISLVDKGACRQCRVAFTKRDAPIKTKQGGGPGGIPSVDAGLPVYRDNTNPQYQPLTRPRKEKKPMPKKVREWTTAIQKGAVPRGHHIEVWDSLVRKAESQALAGKHGGRADVALARLLENDFRSGGALIQYLSNGDKAMSRATAIAKREAASQPPIHATRAEQLMDQRAQAIMKRDPEVSYPKAIQMALEQDPALYDRYTRELNQISPDEHLSILKRQTKSQRKDDPGGASGNLRSTTALRDSYANDADDGDEDDEDDDDETKNNDGARRQRKAKCGDIEGSDRLREKARRLAKAYDKTLAKIEGECPECGEEVDEEDAYCRSCGSQLH